MITVPNIRLRPHQKQAWKSFYRLRSRILNDYKTNKIKSGMSTHVLNWHRRAGKDIFALSLIVKEAFEKSGLYMICLPSIKQAKMIYFDGVLKNGKPVLSIIPDQLLIKIDKKEGQIKIRSKDGNVSTIMLTHNEPNSLVGTSVNGMILSEFAVAPSRVLDYMSQSIKDNIGFALIISTPRGRSNHFYNLYEAQKDSEYGEASTLSINESIKEDGRPIFTWEEILEDVKNGLIQDIETAEQEYLCSWDGSNSNSFYKVQMKQLEADNRHLSGFYDPSAPVYASIDYGIKDRTVIVVGQYHPYTGQIHVLDCYHNNFKDLQHYIDKLKELCFLKGYQNLTILSAHDGARTNMITNSSINDELAKHFNVYPLKVTQDRMLGIENVRKNLIKTYFVAGDTNELINRLKTYQKRLNKQTNEYVDEPVHDSSSDFADSFRYFIRGISELHLDNGITGTLDYSRQTTKFMRSRNIY